MAFQHLGGAPTWAAFSLIFLLATIPHGVSVSTGKKRSLVDEPALPTRATSANDKAALLLMANNLSSSAGSFDTWQDSGDPCSDGWVGVVCDADGNVIEVDLSNLNLQGSIPPQVGGLTHLRYLSLASNSFGGGIPAELGELQQLEALNLSSNRLTGQVAFVSTLLRLSVLDLSQNLFEGIIPPELGSLPNLHELILSNNSLTGPIPTQFQSHRSLTRLLLEDNPLTGELPQWLSKLTSLQELAIGPTLTITGFLPTNFTTLSALGNLRISGTAIGGPIPEDLGRLTRLNYLDLSHNDLKGGIPLSLSGLKNLSFLDLSNNQLSGPIPPALGNLENLKALILNNNSLTGPIPTTVGNLKRLRILRLGFNGLNGTIPAALGNLNVAEQTLMRLHLEHNRLEGPIPGNLAALEDLRTLILNGNRLSGDFPSEFFLPHTLIRLKKVDVTGNQLTGFVPLNLVNPVTHAAWLLGSNYFSDIGPPSPDIFTVTDNNCLGVHLPSCAKPGQRSAFECSRFYAAARECLCKSPSVLRTQEFQQPDQNVTCAMPIQVNLLFFSQHRRAERIFALALDTTLVQFAQRLGLLPQQVVLHNTSSVNRQTLSLVLDVVPATAATFTTAERQRLKQLFDPDNPLDITIPSFTPGYRLVSIVDYTPDSPIPPPPTAPTPSPPAILAATPRPTSSQLAPSPGSLEGPYTAKHSGKGGLSAGAIGGVVCAAVLVFLLLIALSLHCLRRHNCLLYMSPGSTDFETRLQPLLRRFTYMELLEATDYFNDNNRLGENPNGNVFRGILQDRKRVAVKRLEMNMDEEDRSFLNEIRVIGSIHHRNCLELYGYCLDGENRCLVYELMPNGSLQAALFNRAYPASLSWAQYAKILRDTATGLRYLHHDCDYKVIHRDLSPDNILLDQDFTGVVADFGTPKDFSPRALQLDTTPGGSTSYMAPEFLQTGKLTEKCDVYSFGVVMLVVISGQPPQGLQRMMGEEGLVRRAFDAARNGQSLRLLNAKFFNHCSPSEARRFINVALLCVLPDPVERPTMHEVVEMITGRMSIPPIIIPNDWPVYDDSRVNRSQLNLTLSQGSSPSFRFF